MRASHGCTVRAPRAHILSGSSSLTLAEIARGPQEPQGPPRIQNAPRAEVCDNTALTATAEETC